MECATRRAPLHGMMVGSGNAFGTVLRFECNDGYQLSGSVERRCNADRTWSGDPVECKGNDAVVMTLYLLILELHLSEYSLLGEDSCPKT